MPENVYDQPPDLLRFVSDEHHQFLIAIANEQDKLKAANHIQGLYSAAISRVQLSNKADLIVYRLITFTHYHFLFATACQLRCHIPERRPGLPAEPASMHVNAHRLRLDPIGNHHKVALTQRCLRRYMEPRVNLPSARVRFSLSARRAAWQRGPGESHLEFA
jgi:hypothetical protein